jgi:hypothetical protein
MKKFLGVSILTFILGLILVYFSMDFLVTRRVNEGLGQVMKTPSRVEQVVLDLPKSKIDVSGLEIGNPTGFQSKNILEARSISTHYAIGTLTENEVIFPLVELKDLVFNMEKNETGFNTDVLRKRESEDNSKGSSESSVKRVFTVHQVQVSSVQVIVDYNGSKHNIKIPDFQLANITTRGTTRDLVKNIARQILHKIIYHASRQLDDVAKEELKRRIQDKVKTKLKDGVDKLKSKFKNLFK